MSERQKYWLRKIFFGLLLFICTLPCTMCAVSELPPVQNYYDNKLDLLVGQVEPVFLAGDDIQANGFLSPDGKWFAVLTETWEKGLRMNMMDMETYQMYPIADTPSSFGNAAWVGKRHFMMVDYLIRVPDMVVWQIDWVDERDFLAEAEHIVAMDEFTSKGSMLISIDPDVPKMVSVEWTGEDLDTNLADIPHTIVPMGQWFSRPTLVNDRIYSPDGKYFISRTTYSPEDDTFIPRPHRYITAIFDATTEEGVALAHKEGWETVTLGWASDSSGVYLRFRPAIVYPVLGSPSGRPIYKLLVPGQEPSGKKPTLCGAN